VFQGLRGVHTVIIPCRDPGKVLSQELQVGVGAVLCCTLVPLISRHKFRPGGDIPGRGESCSPIG